MTHFRPAPAQSMPVYPASQIHARDGANVGDALSFADELVLDDVYELVSGSETARLSVVMSEKEQFRISAETAIGAPGSELHFDSALTFMDPDGNISEAILLVEIDDSGNAVGIYLLPLGQMQARQEYRLVGIDTENPRRKFAQVACVSFARGTHITLASGEQRAIEDLVVGDRVLTRDDGVQALRWIGQSTVRAVGEFAPICVRAGTLNNTRDLILSPDHRLFIYQREDRLGAGRAELLVKARHLVNGGSVVVRDGGFIDYFQLLFDSHQIIYAEGIAAETMLIDPRTKPVLPDDLSKSLGVVIPGHSDLPHAGLDVDKGLLNHPDVAALLRKASTR